MERWLAIGRVPGWDNLKKFTAELKATNQWRVSAKTTVTTVFALKDGRVVAECHGPDRAEFDAWLQDKGWQVESVTPIAHLAKAGDIWAVK
jgi:uncharacterized protein with PIN domain